MGPKIAHIEFYGTWFNMIMHIVVVYIIHIVRERDPGVSIFNCFAIYTSKHVSYNEFQLMRLHYRTYKINVYCTGWIISEEIFDRYTKPSKANTHIVAGPNT